MLWYIYSKKSVFYGKKDKCPKIDRRFVATYLALSFALFVILISLFSTLTQELTVELMYTVRDIQDLSVEEGLAYCREKDEMMSDLCITSMASYHFNDPVFGGDKLCYEIQSPPLQNQCVQHAKDRQKYLNYN